MAQATDDILIGTRSLETYNHIVSHLESHWKIHNMGIVSHFWVSDFFSAVHTA